MRLTAAQDRAALRLADGRWTEQRIADEAGITRRQLTNWEQHPDFAARVEQHTEALHAVILRRGIADKRRRIDGLRERHQWLQQVIEERARRGAAEVEADTGLTPGGLPVPNWVPSVPGEVITGLIVREERVNGYGSVVEWAVDTGMLAEMRAIEKQIAQELGEWTEKSETKHDGTGDFLDALRAFGAGKPLARRSEQDSE